jgi:hypothetical protein
MFGMVEIRGAAEDREFPTNEAEARVLKIWTLMNEIAEHFYNRCAHTLASHECITSTSRSQHSVLCIYLCEITSIQQIFPTIQLF